MVVIFEGKAGRSACGWKAKLINDFFPEFIVGYCLAATFFADGFVEFEKIELLSTDLWYFDLSDAFGAPILSKVFLEFALLF